MHCIDGMYKRQKSVNVLETLRKHLYGEGSTGACHLDDQQENGDGLAYVSKGIGERIHDIDINK